MPMLMPISMSLLMASQLKRAGGRAELGIAIPGEACPTRGVVGGGGWIRTRSRSDQEEQSATYNIMKWQANLVDSRED